ncbi:tetratricopeptide repeat protein [Streptomyces sp. NPDC003036]|uniref:tetratricopeptide repeat protein n=1 Tax=Streptomyces sp. NPDC003036 TaxID=3154442 RepID=UPI0033BA2F8A
MSGARNRGGRSRGELIRQRARARFVGRREQLSMFAENLGKDPEGEADPAEFLFHVRGVGGVGKSTLLRQWQETARGAGAVTAVVDESDVHGVQQALAELARQLAEQAGPLKEFDRAAEQYRKEQEAAAEPVPMEGMGPAGVEPSMSSRVVSQAALGAASLIPGVGMVTAMANPDAAAQGLDRLRTGARARGRRGRGGDASGVSRAFVTELGKLCDRYPWVVLFFDTWEQTGRYLDGWLRDLLDGAFGPVPANVMLVLAGRDELAERDWASLRAVVADVPLEVFTEAETRALLAARDVTTPEVVEAVLQLSMGLPLLVDLLAHARPGAAEEVDAGGDVVDAAVERFVQWITDPRQRETVLACALVPHLNEDVFAAAAPEEARGLWGWLCGQPFVSGYGGFKQYHAVVRASMVRQQRTHSPQRWTSAHLHLADTHAAWRAAAEHGLPEGRRWDDPRWLRHRLDETYHRLCAQPAAELEPALEQAAHAAGQDTAALRQWTDILEQAARDTADPALLSWADRLQSAVAGADPAEACLTALLGHGRLSTATRAWCHTYRGRHLYRVNRNEEAIAELDRAVAADPRNVRAWAYRGEAHRWLNHLAQAIADQTAALALTPDDALVLAQRGETYCADGRYDEAITDLTAALTLDPALAWALVARGETHRLAGRYDDAVTDFTAAIDLDPTYAWCLTTRGEAHRQAGRHDKAIADFTAALDIDPTDGWALAQRGESHRLTGRYDQAVTDLTAALDIEPTDAWCLSARGEAHRQAGRYDRAIADFTAVLDLVPDSGWVLSRRGEAHRQNGHYDRAIADLTAALDLDPTDVWALGSRGQTHRQAGRPDQAIADFTAALERDPAYAWGLAQRGETHRQNGRYDEAVTDFTAALELDPTDTWALAQRGEAHRQAGRHDKAIADLTAVLDVKPDNAWVLGSRGQALIHTDHHDRAIADLTAALDLDPTLGWALAARAQAHRMAGHHDQAVTDLTAALDLDPTDTWALAERGSAHGEAGRHEQAITDFTAVIDLEPSYAWALAARGHAYGETGRHDQAIADLTAALDLDPALPGAVARRGEMHRMTGHYDRAIADLTAALEREPTNALLLAHRAEAHRQAGHHEQAIADLTAALDLGLTDAWAFGLRGVARRQAGDHAGARDDLERACAALPDDPGARFEKIMLDTVESGITACAEQWTELLTSPRRTLEENAATHFALFRALLLEPDSDIAEATEVFLSGTPDHDTVADLLLYLAELSALDGEPADRARRCRRLIEAWERPGTDRVSGACPRPPAP